MKFEKLKVIKEGNDMCIGINKIFLRKREIYVSHSQYEMEIAKLHKAV